MITPALFGSLSAQPHYLGIDLGGSSIKAAAIAPEGTLIASCTVPFIDQNKEWADRVFDLVQTFQRHLGEPQGIGLCAPGLAATDERSISVMPGRLHGLERFDWTSHLKAKSLVPVLNDAHAALLGEAWVGAAVGLQNVFMLTLGTGVGGASIVDGRLLKGHIGRAGHLGHISINFKGPLDDTGTPGSIESEIGNKTVTERSGGRFTTTLALVEASKSGDLDASLLWARSIQALGASLVSLINVLDPEAILIGGGITEAGDSLFAPLTEELNRMEWRPNGHRVRVLRAQLGSMAGAYGSAWNSLRLGNIPHSPP
jgi:glucokinase